AEARQTVNLAARAAAVAEPGTELAWSVRGERVRVEQPRGSVFYRVEHGAPFQVVTPAGEVEVTGTCFRVALGSSTAEGVTALVDVLEGSVKVRGDAGELPVRAGESACLALGRSPKPVGPA